jgi:hypothetical protein
MLYPMMQSVLLVCVEIDKKRTPQMALSIVIIHRPSSKNQNHFGAQARSYQNLNVSRMDSPRVGVCVTSLINLNFECCHALMHT